jgi:hypothetical protein
MFLPSILPNPQFLELICTIRTQEMFGFGHGCNMQDPQPGDLRGLIFIGSLPFQTRIAPLLFTLFFLCYPPPPLSFRSPPSGLSLSRNILSLPSTDGQSALSSNDASVSRQTQFDFNLLQDRNYTHVCGTSDDGWLVGGGEGGDSFVLQNPDSAHVELVHIGSGDPTRGGLSKAQIVDAMSRVQFPPIKVKPSFVQLNDDEPPEFELRFMAEDNPSLRLAHEIIDPEFINRNRNAETFTDYKFHFHMSITRKISFRSFEDRARFLQHAAEVVEHWRMMYPDGVLLQPDPREDLAGKLHPDEIAKPGGLYLFWGRNKVVAYFPPTSNTSNTSNGFE